MSTEVDLQELYRLEVENIKNFGTTFVKVGDSVEERLVTKVPTFKKWLRDGQAEGKLNEWQESQGSA